MSSHRKFAASAAHRFAVCTASHALEAEIQDKTNKYAIEGTQAHAIAAAILNGETINAGDVVEDPDSGLDAFEVAQEMIDSIDPYVQFVWDMIAKGAKDLRVEFSADLIPGVLGGTADAVFIRKDTLHVCDLKYGKGVLVDPEENLQLSIYALCCLPFYPSAKQVCLNIVQPRARGETIKQWRCSLGYLETIRAKLIAAVEDIEAGNTSFVRGDHCKFCKVLHGCPSYFEVIDEKKLADYSHVLDHIEEIRALCTAVEADAFARMTAGEKIKGWKLVHKQAKTTWVSNALELLSGTEAVKESLVTVTEAKKIFGESIEPYLVKQSSGITMARESDKRQEIADPSMLDEIKEDIDE